MTAFKKESITRRRFSINATRTALYCACLPSELLADSPGTPTQGTEERNKKAKMTGTG
jgi:hypothetical protein